MRLAIEPQAREWRSRAVLYLAGITAAIAATVLAAQLSLPAYVFEYFILVLVVGLAAIGGRGAAIATAIAGVIGDNVLLREPIGRPAITGVREAIDLGLFILVATMVGWLVDRLHAAKARAQQAADQERRAREELNRLVATITHDLATPLTAIQGTIQFARRHASLSEVDLGRLLSRVETASARATSLVRALTDARSIEQHSLSLDRKAVDLRTIVEPIVRMLDGLSDRHPIALALDAHPVTVDVDVDRTGRVVENLITNAIKYSPHGGAIEVSLYRGGSSAVLTVRDHGIGVSSAARHRLFEIGYRAPEAAEVAPGLGLGLYTAAEVIRRHGGTITVNAAEQGGTIFIVRIPLRDDESDRPATAGGTEAESASRLIH